MALRLFNSVHGFSVGLDHDNVIDSDGNIVANNLTVTGNATASNFTANTGVFTGNGSGLTSLAGANVTGQVGNALVAGTVYTNSQPNITSVGTLTSLSVTGNISVGNISASGTVSGVDLIVTTVTANTIIKLESSNSAPISPTTGMFAVADRTNWDPANKGSGNPYPVFYDGSVWNALY